MLAIRLKRMGTKKRPFYRVVVSDSKLRPTGRVVDEVGTYDPCREPQAIKVDVDKLKMWIERGAQPSATVKSFLKA